MNIEALFEQDAHHYHQLQSDWIDATQKYPLVVFDYISIQFITDIPLHISREQFEKLFDLSFNEQDIDAIQRRQHSLTSLLYSSCFVLNPKNDRYKGWIQDRIEACDYPSDYMCNWKQFIATIKKEIHKFGDFTE